MEEDKELLVVTFNSSTYFFQTFLTFPIYELLISGTSLCPSTFLEN